MSKICVIDDINLSTDTGSKIHYTMLKLSYIFTIFDEINISVILGAYL